MTTSTPTPLRVEQVLLDRWDALSVPARERLCAPTRLAEAAAGVVEELADPLVHNPCAATVSDRAPAMVGWLLDETGRMAVVEVAAAYTLEWEAAPTARRRRLLREVLYTAYEPACRAQDCFRPHPDGGSMGWRWNKVAIPLWRQARLAEGYDEETIAVLFALLADPALTLRMPTG